MSGVAPVRAPLTSATTAPSAAAEAGGDLFAGVLAARRADPAPTTDGRARRTADRRPDGKVDGCAGRPHVAASPSRTSNDVAAPGQDASAEPVLTAPGDSAAEPESAVAHSVDDVTPAPGTVVGVVPDVTGAVPVAVTSLPAVEVGEMVSELATGGAPGVPAPATDPATDPATGPATPAAAAAAATPVVIADPALAASPALATDPTVGTPGTTPAGSLQAGSAPAGAAGPSSSSSGGTPGSSPVSAPAEPAPASAVGTVPSSSSVVAQPAAAQPAVPGGGPGDSGQAQTAGAPASTGLELDRAQPDSTVTGPAPVPAPSPASVGAAVAPPVPVPAHASTTLVPALVPLTSVPDVLADRLPAPGDSSRLVMRLDPPDLGHLTVVMRRDAAGLHVHVVTETPLTPAQAQLLREAATAAASAAGTDLAGFDSSTPGRDQRARAEEHADGRPDTGSTYGVTAGPAAETAPTTTRTDRTDHSSVLWL